MKDNIFYIDLNNPIYVLPRGTGFDLTGIFSCCFDYPSNDFLLYWNGIKMIFSYKYEVAYMVRDIMDMLDALLDSKTTETVANFGMIGFHAQWYIKKENTRITIKSQWHQVPRQGDVKKLAGHSILDIETVDFLFEWNKLLELMIKIIKDSGITIEDSYYTYKRLKKINKAITVITV